MRVRIFIKYDTSSVLNTKRVWSIPPSYPSILWMYQFMIFVMVVVNYTCVL